MKTINKKKENKFHAVDFMRKTRAELTEQFLQDKWKYLEYLKRVMEDFKKRQMKAYSQHAV